MDAYQLEFQDSTFDVVTSNQFLEHLDEPAKVIKEMIRVLKPGGKLIVTVPINNLLDNSKNGGGHIQHFDFYQIVDLFESFGNDFKIFWLNKFNSVDFKTGEPKDKNVFGVVYNDRRRKNKE